MRDCDLVARATVSRLAAAIAVNLPAAGKPIGIVGHSTGALHRVKTTDGKPLVQGREVTGFTDGEEEERA
jgi:putative intracellular protease/amidase